MRSAVKTVAADFVAAVKLVGKRVKKRFFGQSLVKSRIENSDLRDAFTENFDGGANSFDVRRIMQRRKFDAIFDAAQNFVSNNYRFGKAFAAAPPMRSICPCAKRRAVLFAMRSKSVAIN